MSKAIQLQRDHSRVSSGLQEAPKMQHQLSLTPFWKPALNTDLLQILLVLQQQIPGPFQQIPQQPTRQDARSFFILIYHYKGRSSVA